MQLCRFTDVEAFWAAIRPLCAADPVRHTVAITVTHRLRSGSAFSAEPALLATLCERTTELGYLIETAPHPMLLAVASADLIERVPAALAGSGVVVRRLTGARPQIDRLAAHFAATGQRLRCELDERLYRLGRLREPGEVAGAARSAAPGDVPLLARWSEDFAAEALSEHPVNPSTAATEGKVRSSLDAGDYLLWERGGLPVSMAYVSAPLLGMSRIGPVYTPPAERHRGFAAAVTAAAARYALAAGAGDVVLFTDLDNPVSNWIYAKIGFRPVCDAATFGPPT